MPMDLLYIIAVTLTMAGGVIGLMSIVMMCLDNTIIKYMVVIFTISSTCCGLGLLLTKVVKASANWTGF